MSLGLDEEKAKASDLERRVDAHYGKLRIIWLAILASLVVIFVVTRLFEPLEGGGSALVFWLFVGLGVGNLIISFYMKHRALRFAIARQNLDMVRGAYIIAFAICEMVGLVGAVSHFSLGHKYYYFLFVLGGFGVVLHKPQRDDLVAAAGAADIWDAMK